MAKSKFYAVAVGRSVGIFESWAACEQQVKGYSGAKFKSFKTKEEAQSFVKQNGVRAGVGADAVTPTTKSETVSNSTRRRSNNAITSESSNTTTKYNATSHPSSSVASMLPAGPTQKRPKLSKSSDDLSFLLSFDGGSRGNPGIAGSGAEVVVTRCLPSSSDGTSTTTTTTTTIRSKTRICRFLQGNQTNNQAEYWGLIIGLECVYDILSSAWDTNNNQQQLHLPLRRVSLTIQGDSKLVIQQMNGIFKVGHVLRSAHQKAQDRMRTLRDGCRTHSILLDCRLEHVYRDANKIADQCANQAMDARRSWSEYIDEDGNSTKTEMPDIVLHK